MPIRCVLQIEEVSQPLHDLGQAVIIDVPDPIAEPFAADRSWLFGDGKVVVESGTPERRTWFGQPRDRTLSMTQVDGPAAESLRGRRALAAWTQQMRWLYQRLKEPRLRVTLARAVP